MTKQVEIKRELRSMSAEQLMQSLQSTRAELFALRLGAKTNPNKAFGSQQRMLKRKIAQACTLLREKVVAENIRRVAEYLEKNKEQDNQ